MLKSKMNKKGDMPTVLLLIVAIILVVIAWMAFYTSERGFGEKSREISIMMKQLEFSEQYVYHLAELIAKEAISSGVGDGELKEKFKERALKHNLNIESEGNVFGKIREDDFTFEKLGEDYELKIEKVLVRAKSGNNEIKRNFDLTVRIKR